MDLFHSLKATIITSQILSDSPLKTTQNYKTTLRTFISFTIFLSLLSFNTYALFFWSQEQNDVSFLFSGATTMMFTTVTYIASVLINYLYFEIIFRLFNKFLCPFKPNHNKFNEILRRKTIIRIFMGIAVITTSTVIACHTLKESNIWNIIVTCSSQVFYISIYIIHIQFLTFVIILSRCFYLINSKLLYLMKNTNILTNSTREMVDSADVCLHIQYCCRENKRRLINTLSELYDRLRMLTEQVNTTYFAHLLLDLLVIYCQLSFNLYRMFYMSFSYQQITTYQIDDISSIIISCSFEIFHISIYIIHIQFITFVIILNRCFYLINCKLLYLTKNTNILTNSTIEMIDSDDVCSQTLYCCRENKRRLINTLSELHDKLRMLTEQVNITYSAHLLSNLLVIYSQLSFSLYWMFYMTFFYQKITTYQAPLPVISWCIHVMELLQLITCCSSASFEVSHFPFLV
ncbi:hypothetical protein L9F63_001613, partial [Diploptera punctata]